MKLTQENIKDFLQILKKKLQEAVEQGKDVTIEQTPFFMSYAEIEGVPFPGKEFIGEEVTLLIGRRGESDERAFTIKEMDDAVKMAEILANETDGSIRQA